VHFVTPNTDGDEDDFEAEAEPEIEPGDQLENTPNDSSGASKTRQPNDESHEASHEDHISLGYQDQSTFADVSVPGYHSTGNLPSIHDVLNTHISPALTTTPSGAYSISLAKQSVSLAGPSANTSNWQASSIPIQRLSQSPYASKISPFGSNNNNLSPYNSSAFNLSAGPALKWPVNSAYEARLFHHYIVYCTNWIDVCDPRRHFATEVPKRSAHFSVILNGILGLASRHLWLMGKLEEDWSQPFVDQCLQALIVALEDPLAHWDENFLIAVILLRLHEEMSDSDDHCHHFGMNSPPCPSYVTDTC
jgi:hypothetical protein